MVIPSSAFIYIDIAILIIYIVLIIIGYKKGFLYELISLLYTGICLIIAWFISPILANLYPLINLSKDSFEAKVVDSFVNLNLLANTITYFLIVFLVLKLLYFIISFIFKKFNKVPVIGKLNQILGILAGIFNATVVTLTLSMLLTLPLFKNGIEVKNKTVLVYISDISEKVVLDVINHVDFNNIKNQTNQFDVNEARKELQMWLETKDE